MRPSRAFPTKLLTFILLVSALSPPAGSTTSPAPAAQSSPAINLPGGDLNTALEALLRAGVDLSFDPKDVTGIRTRTIKRAPTPRAALEQLLRGTTLALEVDANGAFLVLPRAPSESPPIPRRGKDAKEGNYKRARPAEGLDEISIIAPRFQIESPVGAPTLRNPRDDIPAPALGDFSNITRFLTQSFGGGPNQDTHIGTEAQDNSGLGVGINLRGLGAGSTLVLIDGRRVAPGGTNGEFVDILNIPLTAVDYIDVTPYDATARYGADAVAGVANFVMRKDFSGSETHLSGGGGTRGDLREIQLSQTMGWKWASGNVIASVEYYQRGPLPASHRPYASSNLTPFGGMNFDTPFSNPGNIVDPFSGGTWAIPRGQTRVHLSVADLQSGVENLQDTYEDKQIIPGQRRSTLYWTARQDVGSRAHLFASVLVGHRVADEDLGGFGAGLIVPSSNPFYINPAGGEGPVVVNYNFLPDLGPDRQTATVNTTNATFGVNLETGASWNLDAYVHFSRDRQWRTEAGLVNFTALDGALADSNPVNAFDPFGDGTSTPYATRSAIGATDALAVDSQLRMLEVSATGSLITLPYGGKIHLTLGLDQREQSFEITETANDLTSTVTSPPSHDEDSRRVISAFAEATASLIAPPSALRWGHLDLSLATRYEHYSDTRGSVTPKYGLVWSPFPNFALRGTWARSTRPPALGDLILSHNYIVPYVLPDAYSPTGRSPALIRTGNARAGDEHATSWTAGIDYTPDPLPGLSLALTYFNTIFRDRLQQPVFNPTTLLDSAHAALVTRNPTSDQVQTLCNSALYTGGTSLDCASFQPTAIVDLRRRNLATALTSGFDFNTTYRHPLRYGTLDLALDGTWITTFAQADIPGQPPISYLNTQNNPVDLRLRSSVGWRFAGFRFLAAVNFTNRYRDTAEPGEREVRAWTTVDAQLRYDWSLDLPGLKSLRLELDVQNLFDADPPFLNNQIVDLGYDQENANPYGRIVILQVGIHW